MQSGNAAGGRTGESEATKRAGRSKEAGLGRESRKNRQGEQGARGIGEGHGELQWQGQGRAGQQGAGGKGQRKEAQAGQGQGNVGCGGYMGVPLFPGEERGGWWGGVVPPTFPIFLPPPYPAVGTVYPP